MYFFVFLLLLCQLCFAEENSIDENIMTVKIFYLSFDVETPFPLSINELIEYSDVNIELEIDRNNYESIKNDFNTMILEEPKPYMVRIPTFESLLGMFQEREEIIQPYLNARLLIQLSETNDETFIAIGANDIINFNGTLFIINYNLIRKLCNLLDSINLNEIKIDIINHYH